MHCEKATLPFNKTVRVYKKIAVAVYDSFELLVKIFLF